MGFMKKFSNRCKKDGNITEQHAGLLKGSDMLSLN